MKLYFYTFTDVLGGWRDVFRDQMAILRCYRPPIHQLEKLGRSTADVPFDAAFTADLPQTVHTARIILDQLETPLNCGNACSSVVGFREKLGRCKNFSAFRYLSQQMDAFRHLLARFQNRKSLMQGICL